MAVVLATSGWLQNSLTRRSLADAGITDDGDGLTMALGLRDPPVPEDEVDARLTSDDRGQAGRQWPSGPRIGSLSRPGYLVDFNPAGKTLDGPGAKALQGKPSAGEGSRVMAHHRGARGCLGLKTCGEIDSLPYRAELGNAAAYEFRPDQHQTRMDADFGRQRYIRTVPYVGFQILQPLEKLQRCANCALGVIFMRHRITEIDDDAITLKLSHEPAKSLHYRQGKVLVTALKQAKIFRVKLLGQGRVSDQVDKDAGEIAPFGHQVRRLGPASHWMVPWTG